MPWQADHVLAPVRLGQILVDPETLMVVAVWTEGGGAPIRSGCATSVNDAGSWSLAEGAVAVLVRRRGDPQAFWWGPGPEIPFNKLDVLSLSRLVPTAVNPHQPDAQEIQKVPAYNTFWTDREWSSQNPGSDSRIRSLLPGDLTADEKASRGAKVHVRRYDMFGEGPPFLRGVIRTWSIDGVSGSRTDSEDSVSMFFHAGPWT